MSQTSNKFTPEESVLFGKISRAWYGKEQKHCINCKQIFSVQRQTIVRLWVMGWEGRGRRQSWPASRSLD